MVVSCRKRANKTKSPQCAVLIMVIMVAGTEGFSTKSVRPLLSRKPAQSSTLFRPDLSRIVSTTMATPTTTASADDVVTSAKLTSFDLEYYDPNQIHPRTMSLRKSVYEFCAFALQLSAKHRHKRRLKQAIVQQFKKKQLQKRNVKDSKPRWMRYLQKLNEQRKNLVTLADYSRRIVAPSFFFLTLGALLQSFIPQYYAQCITLVATLDPNQAEVVTALIGLAISSTLAAFFTGGRGSLFWIGGSRANYNIRVKLHRNLLLQEAAFFDSSEVGYLLSRINNDVNKIGQVISYHVNVVTRQFAQFIFGSIYLVKISPKLAMWTFGGIGIVAWVSAVYGAFNRDLAEKVQDTFADATAVAETSLSLSETVRAFDGVNVESGKFETAQAKALRLEEVQAWGYGAHKFVSDTLQAFMQGALLWACWSLGRAGGLPAADLTTFIFYTNFVLESSNEVGDQWAKIQGAVGASSSVFDLIRRLPVVRDPPKASKSDSTKHSLNASVETNGAHHPPTGEQVESLAAVNGKEVASNQNYARSSGDLLNKNAEQVNGCVEESQQLPVIEMSNMTIIYGAMDVPAVDQANLQIYRSDRVAIVGRSGSGKSSMLRAILRFYDPIPGGRVAINGKSLTDMPRREIASKVAVVAQEPSLFPMTLLENVLYGIDKDSVDAAGRPYYGIEYRQRALNALERAGIPVHPGNGLNLELDTRVGEGGRSLSGGQRQRVAIARALVRQPIALLLDEPTAALDSQSERVVVEALKQACQECQTMVMVTHRLGVVRSLDVNRVVVMDRGQIVEEGHPEQLLKKKDGLYASLAREQGITALAAGKSLP